MMEQLIAALDNKEREVVDFMEKARKDREETIARLNELDQVLTAVDEDLRRINKARNALRNPSEEKMMHDDVVCAGAGVIPTATGLSSPPYRPNR